MSPPVGPANRGAGAPPVLGVELSGSGAELVPLLAALRAWCRPVVLRPRNDLRPAALLFDALPAAPPDLPWAVASRDPAVLAAAGSRGVRAPDGRVPPGAAYVPPFVRSRLRAARGLGGRPVVSWTSAGWAYSERAGLLPDDLVDTALGCAAVAVVDASGAAPVSAGSAGSAESAAERALAWGAPLVCSPSLCSALRLTPDEHVAVAKTGELTTRAADLAGDDRESSRLSWRGHRWWEDRHDAARTAAVLALGLLPGTARSAQLRMAELGTPPDAEVRQRWNERRL